MKRYSVLILCALLTLAACSSSNTTEQTANTETETPETNLIELTEAQLRNANLSTGTIQQKAVRRTLKVNGFLSVPPQQMVSIGIPLGGYLKSTSLLPGAPVAKGQVLATLEDQQYISLQQDYLTAKARMDFLEKELVRQQELNQTKVSSDKVLQQTQSDYSIQQATLRGLAERLLLIGIKPEGINTSSFSRSIALRSPINGYVSKINANIGKYLQPNEVLFELVNPHQILAELTVFERDIQSLQIGQNVSLSVPSLSDASLTGRIKYLDRKLDENRSVTVVCEIIEAAKGLLPGMFVTASIMSSGTLQTTLPESAIVRYQNKHYAFVVAKPNQFEMIEVKIGDAESGHVIIDIPAQYQRATFVTQNAYTLLMKLKNSAEEE